MRIDNDISLFWKRNNRTIKKALNEKDIIELLTFKEKINNDVNKTSNNIFQWERRFDVDIIYRFMILNVMSEIIIVNLIQIDMKQKNEKVNFQFKVWWHIENVNMNVFEMSSEIEYVFTLIKI